MLLDIVSQMALSLQASSHRVQAKHGGSYAGNILRVNSAGCRVKGEVLCPRSRVEESSKKMAGKGVERESTTNYQAPCAA